jgi:hypothetical protein
MMLLALDDANDIRLGMMLLTLDVATDIWCSVMLLTLDDATDIRLVYDATDIRRSV